MEEEDEERVCEDLSVLSQEAPSYKTKRKHARPDVEMDATIFFNTIMGLATCTIKQALSKPAHMPPQAQSTYMGSERALKVCVCLAGAH